MHIIFIWVPYGPVLPLMELQVVASLASHCILRRLMADQHFSRDTRGNPSFGSWGLTSQNRSETILSEWLATCRFPLPLAAWDFSRGEYFTGLAGQRRRSGCLAVCNLCQPYYLPCGGGLCKPFIVILGMICFFFGFPRITRYTACLLLVAEVLLPG